MNFTNAKQWIISKLSPNLLSNLVFLYILNPWRFNLKVNGKTKQEKKSKICFQFLNVYIMTYLHIECRMYTFWSMKKIRVIFPSYTSLTEMCQIFISDHKEIINSTQLHEHLIRWTMLASGLSPPQILIFPWIRDTLPKTQDGAYLRS